MLICNQLLCCVTFLMIKAHIFVQNKRYLVADIWRTKGKQKYATDQIRADWLYAVQLGQLRRRILKFNVQNC